ncbi:MAG: PAS domain S-box protein [Candidatus Competibacteraceae bacterium]
MKNGMNSQWIEMPTISLRRLLAWPFVLLAAAIVALTLGGIAHITHHQKQKEFARLQAIATFKTHQIATWLREREGDAQLLQSSRYVADLYRRWRDTSDLASRELLLQRLDDYRKIYHYQEVLLLNDQGEPVLATADKLDQAEVYAPGWRDAGWIGLLGALALLAAAATQIVAHQRQAQGEMLESLQQLANERHRLRTLIQTIPDLIWLKDPDGIYLGCNPRFEHFVGAKEADLIGKSDHDFFGPEQADFFRQKDREALAANRPNANEEWITFAEDGHRALLHTIKTPMRDAGGNLIGVLGIGRDITAFREAETGKQAVERQYQALFRAMQDGCALHELIFDAGGQPADYRFLAVNPAFERLIGLKAEHLLGKTVLEVLPCVERHWIDLYGQVVLTGESALFENYSQDLGRYFKVNAFRPEPGQFACIVADITEQKQAEQALSVALEEKTSLLKEVHHRVKNNLQIVTSLLNLQARQVQNPAALAALQDTQCRIRSMALLHETLYREGDMGQADGAVYLSHLCAHLNSVFGVVTGRVRLRHQLAPVALTPDQAVPCGLIVNELVSNAFKHAFPGERGGEIQVALTAEPDGHRVLAVTDNGVGLPPGLDIEQSDTLGLQLVAGLARQLGGAVETRTAAGTVFRIAFPAPQSREVLPS